MTHTEQDKELEKAVWASLASQMTHAINCTELEHEEQDSCVDFTKKNFEQLMQLITADRKRVELEARIDEMDVALAEVTHWSIDDSDSAIHGYGKHRIAELKQELESYDQL